MLTDCCDTTTYDQIGIILLAHKTHILKVPSTSHVYTKYGDRQDLAKGLRLAFQQLQQQCASDIVSKSAQLDPLSGNPMVEDPPINQGDGAHGWDNSMDLNAEPYPYDPYANPPKSKPCNAAPSDHRYPPSIASQSGSSQLPPLSAALPYGQVPEQYATYTQPPGYPITSQNVAIQQQMPAMPGMQFVQGAQPSPHLKHRQPVAVTSMTWHYDFATTPLGMGNIHLRYSNKTVVSSRPLHNLRLDSARFLESMYHHNGSN